MNRQEHHAKAEQLLEQARTEHDSIRRSLILAEAQAHATLALSAPAGTGPPGPGQDRAAHTQSTRAAHPGIPEDSDLEPARPRYPASAPGGYPVPPEPETAPARLTVRGQDIESLLPRPQFGRPPGQGTPRTSPEPRRLPRSARPEGRPPAQDDPKEEPDGPGEQKPGGPEEQKPSDFRPL